MAAVLNFAGAFVSSRSPRPWRRASSTPSAITLKIVLAGLVGAITWNLITWYSGCRRARPMRSSAASSAPRSRRGLERRAVARSSQQRARPSLAAPSSASSVGVASDDRILRWVRKRSPAKVGRGFRCGQLVLRRLLAFTHGTNDAQKTMGIIVLALVASRHCLARQPDADLGRASRRAGDGAGHLRRRVADHPHPR